MLRVSGQWVGLQRLLWCADQPYSMLNAGSVWADWVTARSSLGESGSTRESSWVIL